MNDAIKTISRPLLMKIKPLWLRERFYFKFYQKKGSQYTQLFEQTPLEFMQKIRLNLIPTDESHKHIAFTGFHELGLTKRIIRLAQKGGLLVDVGANCGYYSCLWASIDRKNKVLAFEPSPRIVDILKTNVSINQFDSQIQIIEKALGKDNKIQSFSMGPENQTSWGMLLVEPEKDSIEVPVIRLDDIIYEYDYDYIDVLKIDTEGADTWVLQGAEKLLRQHKIQHIFFEKSLTDMKKLAIDPDESLKFLNSCGYAVKPICCGHTFKPTIDTSLDLMEYYATLK